MKWIVKYLLILGLFFFSACSPVIYEASHSHHRDHRHHVVRKNVSHYPPIEISFFANTSYKGVHFIPITFVMSDGGFKKISFYRGNGNHFSFYAHYAFGNVHFDSDINCRGQQFSPGFRFNQKWVKGQTYQIGNLGKNYPLRGINFKIQRFAKVEKNHKSNHKTSININRHEKFGSPIIKGGDRNQKSQNKNIVSTKMSTENKPIITVKKTKKFEQSKVVKKRKNPETQNKANRKSLNKITPQQKIHENVRGNSTIKKRNPNRSLTKPLEEEKKITNVSPTNEKNVNKGSLMNSKKKDQFISAQNSKEKSDKKENKSKLQ